MYKISIVGLQGGTGYESEIEFFAPMDCADETIVILIDKNGYEPVAMEVEWIKGA